MLFNSVDFFIFFPVVTIAYFLTPHRYRWLLLLLASCFFYMRFIPVYILILFFVIIIDYFSGIKIESAAGSKRKVFLLASLCANIGVLATFKYFNFFNSNMSDLFSWAGLSYPIDSLSWILPIGLSFHTFQSLSYTIEVYRGRQKAERHPGRFALYVMFYPQLVAGPIERPQNLLHQFVEKHAFDYQRVTDGLKLMAWGLFKKVVIADRLAVVVNQVYGDPQQYDGLVLIVATVLFAYQIYCDFSGYSDIAIGAAQVMGFKLMDNFKRPYSATSISEFWRRWHISLSTWFRDYLYIPLGGNRVPKWQWQINLFITFLVSGLWHGANWTFLVWGALHGFYLLMSLWTREVRARLVDVTGLQRFPGPYHFLQGSAIFALVCFAWIFFRATNLSDALYIVTHLFSGFAHWTSLKGLLLPVLTQLSWNIWDWMLVLVFIGILEAVQLLQRRGSVRMLLARQPVWIRWGSYYAWVCVILFFGVFNKSQFIYFQF